VPLPPHQQGNHSGVRFQNAVNTERNGIFRPDCADCKDVFCGVVYCYMYAHYQQSSTEGSPSLKAVEEVTYIGDQVDPSWT
jgi:hypothetical protein